MLYAVPSEHLETFLQSLDDERSGLPWLVRRELRSFLECGIRAHGFARVHCSECGSAGVLECWKDDLVAFSCKGRGFCPSCGARRMHDTAAWLVDRVLPCTPVRKWALSLPRRIRFLCAYEPELCRGVRSIFVRAIASFYKSRAKRAGVDDARTGCVVTLSFDGALRLNVHFHSIWPHGKFTFPSGESRARFRANDKPTDADIETLARALRHRILRCLRKRGALPADEGDEQPDFDDPPLIATLAAASVHGKQVLGARAGSYAGRIGRGTEDGGPIRRGKLCANAVGFSLHAGVLIQDYCRGEREKLCAHAARPPVVHQRMSLSVDGSKVIHKLKKK